MQINKQIQCPAPKQHKSTWCATVVTRIDTLKSGWTHYVYYTTRFAKSIPDRL